MVHDVLLRKVGEALTQFADDHLRPLLKDSQAHPGDKELAAQLLLLQWRSRDAFVDFGEFYCIRLLLDQQSALASYFIDLFSQFHWMMRYLDRTAVHPRPWQVSIIAHTCRLLYAAYKMLPTQEIGSRSNEEFKRAGRIGRMFSSNQLHCKMRQMGFVNLDQGDTLVCLKEELGRGGYGTVFKGVFEANQKRINGSDAVAVKMFTNRSEEGSSLGCQLLQSMEGNVDVKDSFRIELERLISVRHPNIVTPRGYIGERPQGESGLVMDLMDESLHDYLTKVKEGSLAALTELEMLDLMLEIARGMRALHECNLMHRDLKPGNVLLRYNLTDRDLAGRQRFEVKLADFGHTKLYSLALDGMKDKPTQTAPAGTTCYMAPELRPGSAQTRVTLYEEKLDVFSYGTTCFNILIGDPDPKAFVPSHNAFYEAVKTRQWKQWVQDVKGSRSRMVQVVDRCWETEPSLRPTFATLCSLLQHCLRLCLTSHRRPQGRHIGSLKSLKSFQALAVEKYFEHCKSILCSLERDHYVVDLHFTNGILQKIDAVQRPQLVPKEVVELNDYAKDVAMFLESLKSSTLSKAWRPKLLLGNKDMSESEMFDSCLETSSDPLIFIKGLACRAIFSSSPWNRNDEGIPLGSPSPFDFTTSPFDFTNDEAHCELQVDASLVPLLVGFWTGPRPKREIFFLASRR